MMSPHDSDEGYIRLRASKHMASKMSRPATASPNDTEYFFARFDQAAQSWSDVEWSHLNQAPKNWATESSSTCAEHRGLATRSERPQTRKRNQPRPRLMDTSPSKEVKAPPHDGTPDFALASNLRRFSGISSGAGRPTRSDAKLQALKSMGQSRVTLSKACSHVASFNREVTTDSVDRGSDAICA